MRISVLILAALFIALPARVFAGTAAETFAAAESKYQRGQYKEALTEYRAFLAAYPNDWRAEQAQFTAAFILQKKIKDSKQAAEAYRKMAEPRPNAQVARMARFHQAEAYEQAGDVPSAIAILEDLRKKTPEHMREREINRYLKYLRRNANESADAMGWGYHLRGKKWRKNKPQGPLEL